MTWKVISINPVGWVSKGITGVLVKPPWYGVMDKQGRTQLSWLRPHMVWCAGKAREVPGCWLSPHGRACWISKGGYRDAG